MESKVKSLENKIDALEVYLDPLEQKVNSMCASIYRAERRMENMQILVGLRDPKILIKIFKFTFIWESGSKFNSWR